MKQINFIFCLLSLSISALASSDIQPQRAVIYWQHSDIATHFKLNVPENTEIKLIGNAYANTIQVLSSGELLVIGDLATEIWSPEGRIVQSIKSSEFEGLNKLQKLIPNKLRPYVNNRLDLTLTSFDNIKDAVELESGYLATVSRHGVVKVWQKQTDPKAKQAFKVVQTLQYYIDDPFVAIVKIEKGRDQNTFEVISEKHPKSGADINTPIFISRAEFILGADQTWKALKPVITAVTRKENSAETLRRLEAFSKEQAKLATLNLVAHATTCSSLF